ncbi:MAG TPA: hypothetical protein VL221_09665 [Bacteroidota bacterium]|nr:hypothetical protein [Bacteroidota bacterium]
MIPLAVFYIHIVAVAAGFTRRWQEEGLAEGLLAVFFMALIFFVGWSMASFLMKLVLSAGEARALLNRDSASLLLLTAGEAVFYYFYLRGEGPSAPERGERAPERPTSR